MKEACLQSTVPSMVITISGTVVSFHMDAQSAGILLEVSWFGLVVLGFLLLNYGLLQRLYDA